MKNKELVLNLASVTVYYIALWFITSILARYSRDIGIDIVGTSLIWSSVYVVSLFLRPLTGYLADRTSSNLSMTIGGVFIFISSLIFLSAGDFSHLLTGRLLQGLGNAFFVSPSAAAVVLAAGELAGMALGLRLMLISFGGIIAPPIAGYIVDTLGYSPVFISSAVLALVIVTINALMVKGTKRAGDVAVSRWGDAINKVVVGMMIISSLTGALLMAILGIVQAHYRDLGYEASIYGYFTMLFAFTGMISRYLAGRLSLRVRPMNIVIGGHLITLASIALLHMMYKAPESFFFASLFGFGLGLSLPPQQLITLSSVPDGAKNRAMSFYSMGTDAGMFIGPLALGYLVSLYGYVTAYIYLTIVPILAIILDILILWVLRCEKVLAKP